MDRMHLGVAALFAANRKCAVRDRRLAIRCQNTQNQVIGSTDIDRDIVDQSRALQLDTHNIPGFRSAVIIDQDRDILDRDLFRQAGSDCQGANFCRPRLNNALLFSANAIRDSHAARRNFHDKTAVCAAADDAMTIQVQRDSLVDRDHCSRCNVRMQRNRIAGFCRKERLFERFITFIDLLAGDRRHAARFDGRIDRSVADAVHYDDDAVIRSRFIVSDGIRPVLLLIDHESVCNVLARNGIVKGTARDIDVCRRSLNTACILHTQFNIECTVSVDFERSICIPIIHSRTVIRIFDAARDGTGKVFIKHNADRIIPILGPVIHVKCDTVFCRDDLRVTRNGRRVVVVGEDITFCLRTVKHHIVQREVAVLLDEDDRLARSQSTVLHDDRRTLQKLEAVGLRTGRTDRRPGDVVCIAIVIEDDVLPRLHDDAVARDHLVAVAVHKGDRRLRIVGRDCINS